MSVTKGLLVLDDPEVAAILLSEIVAICSQPSQFGETWDVVIFLRGDQADFTQFTGTKDEADARASTLIAMWGVAR